MVSTLVTPSRTTVEKTYELAFGPDGLPVSCNCLGYQFRATCRHMDEHTAGGWQVCCWECDKVAVAAVQYNAARTIARTRGYQCTGCSRRELVVIPDFEARESRDNPHASCVPGRCVLSGWSDCCGCDNYTCQVCGSDQ